MKVLDQIGYELEVHSPPQRIISVVPSLTELLFFLGSGPQIAARTKFCIHPQPEISRIPLVGGTKKLNIPKILSLSPDLIIASKEENTPEDILQLQSHAPVYTTDISTLAQALHFISVLGDITQTADKASQLIKDLETGYQRLKAQVPMNLSALYLIWQQPYMSIGHDTFIHDMMTLAGLDNVMKSHTRYPALTAEEISEMAPDLILLSSEPYPFAEKHIAHFQELSPRSQIILVDGELFSWYGSRILKSFPYFETLKQTIYDKIPR